MNRRQSYPSKMGNRVNDSSLKSFLSFYRPERGAWSVATFLTLLSCAFNMLVPLLIGFTVDTIFENQPAQLPDMIRKLYQQIGGRNYILNHLWVLGVVLLILVAAESLCDFTRDYLIARVAEGGAARMRRRLFAHLQRLPYSWHVKAETGDIVQRCTTDVDIIRRFLQMQFLQMISSFTFVMIATGVMFFFDWRLCLVALAVTPILFYSSYRYFKNRRRQFELWDEAEGELSSRLQENISGIRVVKAFGRQDFELDQLRERHQNLYDYGMKQFRLMGNFWFLSDLLCFTELALIVVIGTWRVLDHSMTLGVLLIFISYADRLLFPLRMLARVLAETGKAQISFGRLKEILDADEEPSDEGLAEPELKGNICFKNVTFRYPDGRTPVLEQVDLTVEAGQTVGILGPTGSGKSTLLLLLQKLYDPTTGELLFDGIDVREINRYHLRRQVGLILQESYIFSRSILDNIRLSRSNASEHEVRKYAKIAHLDRDVTQFREGYTTLVGERGVTLSGGQKQRLAIARTLIRDCPILIFDDSLSAVDTETDRAIRRALRERPKETTTLIVSHRISTLAEADRIYVIENGRTVQNGTHHQLLRQDGLYKRVYQIQHDWLDETN